ncbi:hypothetical protein WJX73_007131 [Symbiochloris irregularis]|uniref:Phosphoglycerate kinase n=1 Tax=Symbiochloris irregularis TaxID=706552 RepID=A0AAW1PT53_9CHLO
MGPHKLHQGIYKRSVQDLAPREVRNKTVFLRCDLNVPLTDDLGVSDDTRIREAVPTIKILLANRAKVLLASHLGRPKGVDQKLRLSPVADRLRQLGIEVEVAEDCIGDKVVTQIQQLKPGQVLLLENTRFHKEEEKNDALFAKQLAACADLYVNDAFGCAHRAHASTEGVSHHLSPCVAGLLMQKELNYLESKVRDAQPPFCAIVGGSKVSSKIDVLRALLDQVDRLIIGGGMVFTFLKARGISVGSSLVEEDKLGLALDLEQQAEIKGVQLLLPTDVVIADRFAADAEARVVSVNAIPDGWMGLDIGPDSTKAFKAALKGCKTVLWNGPMGVFEFDKFAAGTFAIAETVAELTPQGCTTIIGGGDSVAAVGKAGLQDKMSHISTGGGAALELLEGKILPGVACLDDATHHQLQPLTAIGHLAYYYTLAQVYKVASLLLPMGARAHSPHALGSGAVRKFIRTSSSECVQV